MEWLHGFLESKHAFYNGNDSDNDNGDYNENNEQQNDFPVCKHQKHCRETLLLAKDVRHGFEN